MDECAELSMFQLKLTVVEFSVAIIVVINTAESSPFVLNASLVLLDVSFNLFIHIKQSSSERKRWPKNVFTVSSG